MKYSISLHEFNEDCLWCEFTREEEILYEGSIGRDRLKKLLTELPHSSITTFHLFKEVFGYRIEGNLDPATINNLWDIIES
jgi:hypothetical protein